MKTRISTLLLFVALLMGCQQEHTIPDTPTIGQSLRLSGYAGDDNSASRATYTDNNDGKLTFAWDYSIDPENTAESELKMAFVKGGTWLQSLEGHHVVDATILQHSDPEKAEDKHWAELETIDTYNPDMLDGEYDGYTVYAFSPINIVNSSAVEVDEGSGKLSATLNIPTTFTQSGKDNLTHLDNYMYMYAESVLSNGNALLSFNHLTARLRFKVYNWRGEAATLYGVRMEVVGADGTAVPASGIKATYGADGFEYTPATNGSGVRVDIADGGLVFDDETILYAPVFPVGTENPFQDKTLRFFLIAEDPAGVVAQGEYEYFTYELDGETFKKVTKSYDWTSGDLYTFHLYLDDVQ